MNFLKYCFVALCLLVFVFSTTFAEKNSETSVLTSLSPILIDNFEDGNITDKPSWWKFDGIDLGIKRAVSFKIKELGKYYLDVKGIAKEWYVGGIGMYLAKPVSDFTHLQMDVYGTGANSGKVKIELFDDDNENKTLEQNVSNNYAPINDDRFANEVVIDWEGWRQILVPFNEFSDINPGVGNDTWDPDGIGGSGGLLHVQFIVLANSATGNVGFKLDNIKVVKYVDPDEEYYEDDEE